jgi:alpha-galactosidase
LKEKIVLIGAGSVSFTRGLVADFISRGRPTELALVDTDPDALSVAEALSRKMIEARGAPFDLLASTDRRDVLRGATVVICTIGVGGRRAWEKDVLIPRKYGIFQPVGDSVMPGGTSRALRMIPAVVSIAEDVLEYAPSALFFNYSNPMAPICRAVIKSTGASVTGLCHGVKHVADYLAAELDTPVSQLDYSAVGMNHLTWFTDVRANGVDAMPRLRSRATEKLTQLALSQESPVTLSPFSWHLLQLFGAFPAVLDRHVAEFFPHLFPRGAYYGMTLGVDAYSFEKTIADGDEAYAQNRADALSDDPLGDEYFERIGGEHEQVADIIDSIRGGAGHVYSANLPNRGQVPNLPDESIIESPAVAECSGLRPIVQAPLAPGIVGTLAARMAWVETVVDAALEGSRESFIQALILDGAVESLEIAVELADELLASQAEYLPQFEFGSLHA